jgi:hypothetical protein
MGENKVIERTILTSMEEIVACAKAQGLSEEFYKDTNEALEYISGELGLSHDEAMLLSLFVEKSSTNRIWISSIAEMINVSNIRIISMMNVADGLVKKGYLKSNEDGKEEKYYGVPISVVNSIRQNQPVVPKKMEGLTEDELFDRLNEIFDEEDMGFWRRDEYLRDLVSANQHLNYCKKVHSYGLYGADHLLVHVFANRLVNEDDDDIGTHDWEDFLGSKSHVRRILRTLKAGTSSLIRQGILEPKAADGIRDANYYHFTDKAKEDLFPDMDLGQKSDKHDKVLIPHTSFAEKKLFYSARNKAEIDRLAELLQNDKFKQVTDNLSKYGMRKGFACLFYGSPGTGKTETVNQLARMTGRDVLLVDVTRIKSCWVGESEQNIKALFDRYRRYVKDREVAPILLFNEADAVLGVRQEGAQRAVDKMENSIQNIILQEMETLEGIMIATTNITANLDKAFDRRFIYKIEFERPTVEAKQQIWKSMIPALSDSTARALAKEFDMSGGQIENVARKYAVEHILSGVEPTDEQIRDFCQGEVIGARNDRRARIGF